MKAPRNAKEVWGKKEQHSRSKPDAPRSGVLPALPQGVGKVSPPIREEVWHAAMSNLSVPYLDLLLMLLLAAAPVVLVAVLSLLETSLAMANQITLAAEFGPVSGIGPCLKPQEPHESNKLSSTARDQSICPWRTS